MAAISSLTTRSGKLRALSRAAIRMLGHDVDGEPTRIGDSLRTVSEGDAQMWEQLPIITAAMVAERIAKTRGSNARKW